jgi:NAD(P)-dependent dehydrogenase (short-subunit alcohol dehydrogenase family)
MGNQELSGTTAVVTGASRGFGQAIATELAQAGVRVVGVARDAQRLADLHAKHGDAFVPVVADVADPVATGKIMDEYRPQTLVLNAGANPLERPLYNHTWETFSRNWEVDVAQAFHWVREALLLPLAPGSTVISMSSGAILRGSPLSGGYAGAKATVRFISSYAKVESNLLGLGIRFISLLPQLTAATDLGRDAANAYARQQGVDIDTFLERSGFHLTPEQVGKSVLALASDSALDSDAYVVSAAGFNPVG